MTRRPLRGFDRERLIDLRMEKGYTRGDLARFAEVSVAAVRAWESGQATPQVDRLARVAAALDVPMSELVRISPHDRYLGDLRVQAGLTQPQLALQAGISTASLSSLELGETSLRETVAERLARALGVDTAEVRAAYERARTRPPGTPV
ncbi:MULTISPECIES: helix-turn-helix domain-containing protein [Rhodococcus]|uniref:helix-turn-helix domain-containing protein n=1 Tax=Rhodococcus TaxID=1827 RepID=UPI001E3D97DD|nr:helix-turn-helix transcriptional regulator [Rhodococcus pyridinivorans]MCD2118380.1 XRE family transcriptional regulator [Rhodococcus pyridinivorans]MCZ4627193.1 helix-turn-helix transcriptional regulator [Rhodococcus pyridinivorans]MCZ4648483.1 helix-turn-helix transcriptional regulator [Rhodococcus pyridinivorans]MDJ0481181.1 helix-turn-helix transcriptional regulator [Rhodococcus pyridinivorans]MDV7254549.1 helix-turn-helix transcriptional regulator [Rhodococcus pyridinivorans]